MIKTDFYSALGSIITTWHVDEKTATLTRIAETGLPAPVQYAWRHASLPVLYIAISDRFSCGGNRHGIAVMGIDPLSGRLTQEAPIHWLLNRPVHLTVNREGNRLAVAYNDPSEVSVHRLDRFGHIEEPEGVVAVRVGIYAHQVRFAPNDRYLIVPARGNDATPDRSEEPGSLEILRIAEEVLQCLGVIAPSRGFGFGPRHVDFHPNGKWMYVSVERQNELHMFELGNCSIGDAPVFVRSTLSAPWTNTAPQLAGAIHVSIDGRFVFISNRADGTTAAQNSTDRPVFAGGENNVAVFAINQDTGEPSLIQHADVHGFHPRSFGLHPDGSMLVAATLSPMDVCDAEHGDIRRVEAALSVFNVAPDGKLTRTQTVEIDTDGQWLFWCGMIRRSI
jgi:6-phosphogluconolactonase